MLGLNDTQESSLGMVVHYADKAGLPLLDLQALRTHARAPTREGEDSVVEQVVKPLAFKDFMRTAAREVVRGMFKSGRR